MKPSQPDSLVQPPGFTIFRQDRDHQATGKRQGGGVCFLVNDRWCTDVRIISQGCTADLEHLTIKCRPFYLPREFSSVTLTSAYIHPRADVDSALGALCDVISDCENRDPDTMSIVAGDFNQASLSTVLPNYKQQITCPTRGPNTLDHCYCPIKSAYKSVQRPPLGNSDHSTILLIPYYKQELRTSKPIKRAVTLWPESAIHQLQDCFQDTLWTVFKGEDLNEFTETVCDYIGFCTDVCLPTKVVTQYPNNKPWFSKQLRSKVVAKDNAYRLRDTDPDAYRKAKSDLKKAIRQAKRSQRDKAEDKFETQDTRDLWSNLKLITQYKGPSRSADTDDVTLPDRLNKFYARSDEANESTPSPAPRDDNKAPFVIQGFETRRSFSRLNERKSSGPDGISPRLLKNCAHQLASVFTVIFNWSLQSCQVPYCLKKATIIPIPKKNSVSCLNDYRPVALTSAVIKCLEEFVLKYLNSLVPLSFDQFQFAYRKNSSTDDAISIFMHKLLEHLEKQGSYARVLFIDYSSAFNTIVPSKLHFKLIDSLKLPVSICNWILDFLLNRHQVVKVGNNYSSPIVLNTGAPQGCKLSPKLYSLFTSDCVTNDNNFQIVKFADDTTATGYISDNVETNYRTQVNSLVNWCNDNDLILNVSKTKEMIVDFRKTKNVKDPVSIQDTEVEIVESFQFLGTYISNDLSWHLNSVQILKKARQRLYLLRRLKSFGVRKEILVNFYRAIIENILTSAITVWFGRVTQKDLNRLCSVVRTAERIIGTGLPSLHSIYRERTLKRTNSILNDDTHPANVLFDRLPSGRLRNFKGKKRFTDSFIPSAVKTFNENTSRKFLCT